MAQSEILEFLDKNRGKKYSVKELAEVVKINKNSVTNNVKDMKKYKMINVVVEKIDGYENKVHQRYYL